MTSPHKSFENRTFQKQGGHERYYRDQIITTQDLLSFKTELLDEIKSILKELNGQGGKKWLRSAEVRKLLSISPGTLQNLRINGTLPYTKVGGVLFYDSADIQQMLEVNRVDNSI